MWCITTIWLVESINYTLCQLKDILWFVINYKFTTTNCDWYFIVIWICSINLLFYCKVDSSITIFVNCCNISFSVRTKHSSHCILYEFCTYCCTKCTIWIIIWKWYTCMWTSSEQTWNLVLYRFNCTSRV